MGADRLSDLRGKWVVVTGAASGIGRATALAFARRGAHIVAGDLNVAGLQALQGEIGALNGRCETHRVDVSDEAAVRAFAAAALALGGAPHVVVNNAGIGYIGSLLDTAPDVWQRMLAINVMGVVHGCRAFLPAMTLAGGARRIVNVASAAGLAPAPNMSAYAATKFAVVGLSETLSIELELAGSGVGLTTVCPGIIDTPITRGPAVAAAAISAAQLDKLRAYYRASGAPPEVVGEAIVDGVRRGKPLVLVGPYAKPIYHLRRLSRSLLRKVLLADARKMGYAR